MKLLKTKPRGFSERPFFTKAEIERTCVGELQRCKLLPASPGPVRIDRFIEKRFNTTPNYDDLEPGILGYTVFGERGVEEIVISRKLADDSGDVSQRRLNTTLAHEAGHGLFHAHLFALAFADEDLFFDEAADGRKNILCREGAVGPYSDRNRYDGRWWEYQANRAIGPLLIPRPLLIECVADFSEITGKIGVSKLPGPNRSKAIRRVSEVFDVNPIVAKIRIEELLPRQSESQMTL